MQIVMFDRQSIFIHGMKMALLIKSKVGWSLPNPPGGLS